MPTYRTSDADARALARRWLSLMPGHENDKQGEDWWTRQIQQDGSTHAWQNYSNSAEPQRAGVVAKAQQMGFNPIELQPGQGELHGTNTTGLRSDFARKLGGVVGAGGLLGAIPAVGNRTALGSVAKEGGGINSYVHDVAIPAAGLAAGAIGAGALGGAAGGAAASALPGIRAVGDLLKGGGGGGGGNGGGSNLPLTALEVAQGLNAANLGAQSSQYAKDALHTATSNWDANQPLRDQGRAGMLRVQGMPPTDLSGLNVGGNPFSRLPSAPVGANGPAVPNGTEMPGLPPKGPTRPVSGWLPPSNLGGIQSGENVLPNRLNVIGQNRSA